MFSSSSLVKLIMFEKQKTGKTNKNSTNITNTEELSTVAAMCGAIDESHSAGPGSARLRPCQAREAPGQAASLRQSLDPALQEMVSAPLLLPEEGWVENLLFPFSSVLPLAPHAPPAQPWSQVSVATCTQTPLWDALPSRVGSLCSTSLGISPRS